MTTTESGSPTNNPGATSGASSSTNNSVAVTNPASSGIKTGFLSKLLRIIQDWAIATIEPALIIIKNTLIFGLFLLVDKFIFWLITLLFYNDASNKIINLLIQGITIASVVIISSFYVLRLFVELIDHREELLGISRDKKGN